MTTRCVCCDLPVESCGKVIEDNEEWCDACGEIIPTPHSAFIYDTVYDLCQPCGERLFKLICDLIRASFV